MKKLKKKRIGGKFNMRNKIVTKKNELDFYKIYAKETFKVYADKILSVITDFNDDLEYLQKESLQRHVPTYKDEADYCTYVDERLDYLTGIPYLNDVEKIENDEICTGFKLLGIFGCQYEETGKSIYTIITQEILPRLKKQHYYYRELIKR